MTDEDRNRANGGGRGSSEMIVGSFTTFLNGWLGRQQQYLDELLSAEQCTYDPPYDNLKDLICRVLAHYQQYYEEKSRMVQRDVFLVFCPTWFSSFERSLLWIAGFRPALAFRLVSDNVFDLSQEQSECMQRLIVETRKEEKILNDELARIQESMAGPPLLEIARQRAQAVRLGEREIAEEAASLDTLRKAMEEVVASADMLRITTTARVVGILNPVQKARFLTAAGRMLLAVRRMGSQKDGEK
ncbi:hypothetical protein SLE2022_073920 [Rubroshorea leprosula]